MTILCAYAPIAKAPSYLTLKSYRIGWIVFLKMIPAHVGVYDNDEELWTGVLGKHGIGVCNLIYFNFVRFCI